jgi:hypothetical protein
LEQVRARAQNGNYIKLHLDVMEKILQESWPMLLDIEALADESTQVCLDGFF